MNDDAVELKAMLASELKILARNGVGRPLPPKHGEGDIARLVRLSRKLVIDSGQPSMRVVTEAVRRALTDLFPPPRQEAAAILFGVDLSVDLEDQDYKKTVLDADRRLKIAELLGVAQSTYLRQPHTYEQPLREDVAERIIALERLSRAKISGRPKHEVSGETLVDLTRTPSGELQRLAKGAITLGYAAAVPLFLEDVLRDHPGEERDLLLPTLDSGHPHCERILFGAWLEYLMASNDVAMDKGRYSLQRRFSDLMDQADCKKVERLDRNIRSVTGGSALDEFTIIFYMLLSGRADAYSHPIGKDVERVDSYYNEVWKPWYYGQFRVWDPDQSDEAVEPLAKDADALFDLVDSSNGIATLLSKHQPLPSAWLARARRTAVKQITSYFTVEDWEPIGGGPSLRARVEVYFSEDGPLPLQSM